MVNTNGATANGQIPYYTNSGPGYVWGAPSGGGSGGSGIATNNGTGWGTTLYGGQNWTTTNLSVIGTTWLNNSNIMITNFPAQQVYEPAYIIVTGTTNYDLVSSGANPAPNGIYVAANDLTSNAMSSFVFTNTIGLFTNSYSAGGQFNLGRTWSIQYTGGGTNTIWSLDYNTPSQASSTEFYQSTNNITGNPSNGTITNAYPDPGVTRYANYPVGTMQFFQSYTNYIPPYNLVSNSIGLEILATNGVGINELPNTNYALSVNSSINVSGNYYINGQPIGSSSIGNIYNFVYVYDSSNSIYNGIYTAVGYVPVFTNDLTTAALLMPGGYSFEGTGFGIPNGYYLVTNAASLNPPTNPPSYFNSTLFGTYQPYVAGSFLPAPVVAPFYSAYLFSGTNGPRDGSQVTNIATVYITNTTVQIISLSAAGSTYLAGLSASFLVTNQVATNSITTRTP
jgi:hypothetical protein